MASAMSRLSGVAKLITVFVVVALVGSLVLVFGQRDGTKYLTASFQQSNSLYKGSDVKILGVPVGKVDSITPEGDSVRVRISYRGDVKLPDDVKAVIVSPSIVGDRFVQLTPAYDGGAVLADGARLSIDRTAVPVELDQVYSSINDLSKALGPDGANKDGALSQLVTDSARQLDGQGAQLNETLRNFGKLSQTLSDNKDELFGSLREVNDFVGLLNRNDGDVRSFFDSTARVAQVLEGERGDLKATLEALSRALIDVRTLVRENRGSLRTNVENLTGVAEVLGRHQKDIDEFTVSAPTALSNVALSYNGELGSLDNHADIVELLTGALPNLGSIGCAALADFIPVEQCEQIGGIIDGLLGGVTGNLPLPRSAAAGAVTTPTAEAPRSVSDMLAVK